MADPATPALIDLRSDTVTRPTRAMRHAMASAEVGDDGFGEDPTVRRLEEYTAELFGHEAGLFVVSGVMANQLALKVMAVPGTEVVVESESHFVNYEFGAGALIGGVQFRGLQTTSGQLDADQVAAAIRVKGGYQTPTSMVSVEQTHNRHGGTYYDLDQLAALRKVTRDAGLPLHMDGARLFNAAVAAGVEPGAYGALVDGLFVALSKGLAAPVGSVMVGSKDALAEAKLWRKRLGGGWRQAGHLAAAGLVALQQNVQRLAEDHEHAQQLAAAAAELHPSGVDLSRVRTNIVFLEDVDAAALVVGMKQDGVLVTAMDPRTIRLVTHIDVDGEGVARAIASLRRTLAPV